ncbi:MAG: response regulator, partial [Chloroflexi bacterium]
YTDEEIESLRLLSHQIAIAVENARLYRQVEAYSKGLEAQVQERTQALEVANQALSQEKSTLDAVIHNIADGLVVTDSAGHILLTNPVFQRMVGRPATWLQGQSLADLPFDEGLVMVVAQALEEAGQVFTTDVQAAKRIYRASATALQTDGQAIGVVTVLRDVTHEVEVDRMKTDFISTVSHELRTPLTSVLGFARLIRKAFEREIVPVLPEIRRVQRAKKRILDNLTIIESESQRLTRLINDVLDIAKMEAGRMEWHMAETDLGEVIRQAIAATTALASEKGLPIQVTLPPEGLPLVWGDRDRLIQVMTNLLSNAIKFTERGQIEVRGEVVPEEAVATLRPGDAPLPPGEWVAVHVADTGVGIRAEDLPHVFEKFRQVGNALTNRPRGTGLGLSICKEIVEHHGGQIWVESQVGVGSTFSFVLPLTRRKITPETPAEPEMAPLVEIRRRVEAQLPLPPSGTKTILVADDEANIRELLRQELTEAGYRVIEAADGPEALEKARRERPDLIILDVMMPGVSGFDVTSVLKADEQTQEIPILILSIIEDRERGLRLGADAYLTKPVEVNALLTTIARLLARDRDPTRRKVLVIDRDQSAVEAITRTLRERGYEVVEAYDPRGAILKARREKPDLVILDAMISQMNDYEVLKALRYQDREGRTCIIVLAGEVSPQQEAEARRQGADDVARREDLPGLLDEGR